MHIGHNTKFIQTGFYEQMFKKLVQVYKRVNIKSDHSDYKVPTLSHDIDPGEFAKQTKT